MFLRFAWLVLFAALVSTPVAAAGVRQVEPGDSVELDPDEGLLLIAVDTPVDLSAVRIERDGAVFGHGMFKRITQGRTSQLFVAPKGRYRWKTVTRGEVGWDMGDDAEYAFDVQPGVVNYPGDLLFRPQGRFRASMDMANRGLLAIDWLEKEHPAIWRAHGLAYTGHYPDPFPARYHADSAAALPPHDGAPVPAPGPLPIDVGTLWKPSMLGPLEINPAGDLLAMVTTEELPAPQPAKPVDAAGVGEAKAPASETRHAVYLVDLKAGTRLRAGGSRTPIGRLDWTDDRTLLVSVGGEDQLDTVFVVKVTDVPGQPHRIDRLKMPRLGMLVDPVRGMNGFVLFLTRPTHNLRTGVQVHKVYIGDQASIDDFEWTMAQQLDRGIENDEWWMADVKGRLRAAVLYDEAGRYLVHGIDGNFREVIRLADADEQVFSPFALSADGNLFYGYAEKDRAQRELVEFDPATRTIGRTLFSRPGHDVEGALFDERRNLIGATYFDGGIRVSHYFDAETASLDQRLRAAFPGRTVLILTRDAQGRNLVVLVAGSDQPEAVYHYDVANRSAALVQEGRPWLAGRQFAPTHIVRARSKDGLDIEAYLTLPAAASPANKAPVVVLSHGGPIDVRDSRQFDPEVQFLAALGYAVLQVNFRGSDGYGRAFADAGRKNHGTAIEDDIDAALAVALAQHPLDGGRMCAMGASYGGYSALVSAVRWPGRYRCVVSMSGVSDRVLFFTASDGGRSEKGRKQLEDAIGDPRTQLDAMLATSPLYHVDKLTVPVMLVHGTEDRRVDFEHTRRLARLLDRAGRPPVLITLEGAGHGIERDADLRKVYEAVAGFLRANLGR